MILLQVAPNPLDFLEPGAISLLIAYLFFSIATVITAFVKGWVVPKFIYDRAVERGDKAVDAIERLTDAIEELTREVRYSKGDR